MSSTDTLQVLFLYKPHKTFIFDLMQKGGDEIMFLPTTYCFDLISWKNTGNKLTGEAVTMLHFSIQSTRGKLMSVCYLLCQKRFQFCYRGQGKVRKETRERSSTCIALKRFLLAFLYTAKGKPVLGAHHLSTQHLESRNHWCHRVL